jgi:hypothetical protein
VEDSELRFGSTGQDVAHDLENMTHLWHRWRVVGDRWAKGAWY